MENSGLDKTADVDDLVNGSDDPVTSKQPAEAVFVLKLTAQELVALHTQLVESCFGVPYTRLASVRRRVRDMLVDSLQRISRAEQVIGIAERLAKGMQANAYIKRQERKIASIAASQNEKIDHDPRPQSEAVRDDEIFIVDAEPSRRVPSMPRLGMQHRARWRR